MKNVQFIEKQIPKNLLENKYFSNFYHENARISHGKCLNLIFIANKNLAQFENVRVKFQNIQTQLKTVTTEWLILNILVGVWLRQNISSADE